MAKPFDATLKQLVDRYCQDWVGFICEQVGLPPNSVAVPLDSDLSTLSLQSDKLFRVAPPHGGLIHLELQSAWGGDLPPQLHYYNTFAAYKHNTLPVRTVLLLLRPEADSPKLTGRLSYTDEIGEYLNFRYHVLRLWQIPYQHLLDGPVGLLPLALLTDDAAPLLSELVTKVDMRLEHDRVSKESHSELLSACNILLGLRYDNAMIQSLFRELRTMRESSTYQAILDEGRLEGRLEGEKRGELQGLREAIIDATDVKLGLPPVSLTEKLESIVDREQLRRLIRVAVRATSWDEIIAQM